jgi:hypothetical protein
VHGTANKLVDVAYSGRGPEERGVDARRRNAVWIAGDTQGRGNRDLGAWRPARSDDTRQREVLGGASSARELAYAARVEA